MNLEVNENNVRLDVYLTNNTELSRTKIQKLIKEGNILVNNKVCPSNYKVKEKDLIEIENICDENIDTLPEKMDLDIVYEDDYLLIINKKSGVVVHPAVGNYNHTLVNGLLYHFNTLSNKNTIRPGIVHRLDKDTSGIVLFAKNEKMKNTLQKNWNDYVSVREYIAVVTGKLKAKKARLVNRLLETKTNLVYITNKKEGKEAITNYEVIKENDKYSLLKINLETGRKNQIRVQLANIDCPIVGDNKYGEKDKNSKATRLCLHANRLKIYYPKIKKEIMFEVKTPKEFKKLI